LPADLYFGECAGVSVISKGRVFVFTHGNSTGPAYGATAAHLYHPGPTQYLAQIRSAADPLSSLENKKRRGRLLDDRTPRDWKRYAQVRKSWRLLAVFSGDTQKRN
jgi:hypothetical protein